MPRHIQYGVHAQKQRTLHYTSARCTCMRTIRSDCPKRCMDAGRPVAAWPCSPGMQTSHAVTHKPRNQGSFGSLTHTGPPCCTQAKDHDGRPARREHARAQPQLLPNQQVKTGSAIGGELCARSTLAVPYQPVHVEHTWTCMSAVALKR